MKLFIRIYFCIMLLALSACGKKKCNTCPDWGKAETRVEEIEKA